MNQCKHILLDSLKAMAKTAPVIFQYDLDRFHEAIGKASYLLSGKQTVESLREQSLQLKELLEQAIFIAPENPVFMQFLSDEGLLTELLRLETKRSGGASRCSDEILRLFLQRTAELPEILRLELLAELSLVCPPAGREEISAELLRKIQLLPSQTIYFGIINGVLFPGDAVENQLRHLCCSQESFQPEGRTPSLTDPLYVSVKLYLLRFLTNLQVFCDLVPEDFISLLRFPEHYDYSGFQAVWWPLLNFRRYIPYLVKRRSVKELVIHRFKDYRSCCTAPVQAKLEEIITELNRE